MCDAADRPKKKKQHADARQETSLLLFATMSGQRRYGDVLSRERDLVGRRWRCLGSFSIHSRVNVRGSSYSALCPAGWPVSRMSLGSRPTEIPALRHTLTPFGVGLYF